MKNIELWAPIINHPGYFVSSAGRVKSLRMRNTKKERILKSVLRNGYPSVNICKEKIGRLKLVHCLVLEAFVGSRPSGFQAAHNNGIRDDNRLENLRWATVKENSNDKSKHGTLARGETIGTSKLKAEDVLYIRNNYKRICQNKSNIRELSKKFNISKTQIKDILKKKSWKHI